MSKQTSGMLRANSKSLGIVFRALDVLLICVALEISVQLTQRFTLTDYQQDLSIWGSLIFLVMAGYQHLYASWRVERLDALIRSTFAAWFCTVLALLALGYATKTSAEFSRLATFVWVLLTPLLLIALRYAVRRALEAMRSMGYNTRTLAIVGKTHLGSQLLERIEHSPWLGMKFVGYFDDRAARRQHEKRQLGDEHRADTFAELLRRARAGEIDYVYVTLPMKAEQRIVDLVAELSDTTASVYMVPDFFVFDMLHGRLTNLDGLPVISLFESPFLGVDGWLKRLEDIVVASVVLLIITIPMLLIAAGIKLTSPGPVLFKQRRYGLSGKEVEVWKFRTMSVMEEGSEVRQATRNDSRITPFGAFLRRTSLDELPQFINVLQGTMSVVGPRPHAVSHNEQYRRLIRGYMLRHAVKPGITGWAQVNGWRGETDTMEKMEMRVKYDLEYVKFWSLMFDLRIIAMTLFRGFVHQNAY